MVPRSIAEQMTEFGGILTYVNNNPGSVTIQQEREEACLLTVAAREVVVRLCYRCVMADRRTLRWVSPLSDACIARISLYRPSNAHSSCHPSCGTNYYLVRTPQSMPRSDAECLELIILQYRTERFILAVNIWVRIASRCSLTDHDGRPSSGPGRKHQNGVALARFPLARGGSQMDDWNTQLLPRTIGIFNVATADIQICGVTFVSQRISECRTSRS